LRLVILLVDIRRDIQELDLEMIRFLRDEGLPYLIVATKSDKLNTSEIQITLKGMSNAYGISPRLPVPFSSVTGRGKKEVWNAIKAGILGDGSLLSESIEQYEDDDDDDDDEENREDFE
jgi:GTP-binding protein